MAAFRACMSTSCFNTDLSKINDVPKGHFSRCIFCKHKTWESKAEQRGCVDQKIRAR